MTKILGQLASLVVLLPGLFAATTNAQTLTAYTFDGGDPVGDLDTPVLTNATVTPFSRTNIVAVSAPDVFRSEEWTLGALQDASQFIAFTVTPSPTYAVSLTALSFDVRRSVDKATPAEKEGPLLGEVRVFQGTSLTLVTSQDFVPTGEWQTISLDFTGFTPQADAPITVRFYAWDAGHHNGWLDLDNIILQGTIDQVPEPRPGLLVLAGLFLAFLRPMLLKT